MFPRTELEENWTESIDSKHTFAHNSLSLITLQSLLLLGIRTYSASIFYLDLPLWDLRAFWALSSALRVKVWTRANLES